MGENRLIDKGAINLSGLGAGNNGFCRSICFLNGYIYAAFGSLGLRVIEFNGTNFTLKASDLVGDYRDVCTDGTYIYAVGYSSGLKIFSPYNGYGTFNLLKSDYRGGYYETVSAYNGNIFVGSESRGLRVYNYNDIQLNFKGYDSTSTSSKNAYTDGQYVYIVCGINGLKILNLNTLEKITSLNDGGSFNDVCNYNGKILVTKYTEGISCYSFDGNIIEKEYESLDDPHNYLSICTDNNFVYTAGDNSGVKMWNIDTLTLEDVQYQAGSARNLFVDNNYLYVANWNDGVRIYEIDIASSSSSSWSVESGYSESSESSISNSISSESSESISSSWSVESGFSKSSNSSESSESSESSNSSSYSNYSVSSLSSNSSISSDSSESSDSESSDSESSYSESSDSSSFSKDSKFSESSYSES
ncbi:MAG: hypothetical protein M0Q13_14115, partial [Methanothrix sp.]|nr:hypothetical protein [Methanothrix sp.]